MWQFYFSFLKFYGVSNTHTPSAFNLHVTVKLAVHEQEFARMTHSTGELANGLHNFDIYIS